MESDLTILLSSLKPPRPTFASTLKLGLGSHCGDLKSTPEPKLGPQQGLFEPSRVVLKGDSSNTSGHTPPFVSSLQSKEPSASIAEFSACCILGKIWGERIPLSAIIHRTRNEWKFTKGQIDYVDLGNDWLLIRFANSQDKGLVFLLATSVCEWS